MCNFEQLVIQRILAIVLSMPKMLGWKRLLNTSRRSSTAEDSALLLRLIQGAVGQAKNDERQLALQSTKLQRRLACSRILSECQPQILGGARASRAGFGALAEANLLIFQHIHESRFTDHRFTLLLALEFAEKGAEVYAKS